MCLLFAYLNPEHELAVGSISKAAARRAGELLPPDLAGVAGIRKNVHSGDERLCGAGRDPILDHTGGELEARSLRLFVMQSNGGITTARSARELPIQTLLSGPVGGAIGAQQIARTWDERTSYASTWAGRPSMRASSSAPRPRFPTRPRSRDYHSSSR